MNYLRLALENQKEKSKTVMGFKVIDTTPENIKNYNKKFPGLSHVKTGFDFKGVLLIDDDNFVAVMQCNVKTGYIVALEVGDNYRRRGIASALINLANREFHCHKLSVRKNNWVAIKLYEKHGYKVIREDATMYYMEKS